MTTPKQPKTASRVKANAHAASARPENVRKWKAAFDGRLRGAIGVREKFTNVDAYGDTEEAAILSLYDRYEHISNPVLTASASQNGTRQLSQASIHADKHLALPQMTEAQEKHSASQNREQPDLHPALIQLADTDLRPLNESLSPKQTEPDHDQDCTCDRCEERDKASLDAWVAAQEKYRADKARKFILMFCTPCDMEREHINAEGYWNCIACGQSTCASSGKPETHAEAERECDKLKEQIKTLLAACKAMVSAIDSLDGVAQIEYPFALKLSKARYKGKGAIASVENEGK